MSAGSFTDELAKLTSIEAAASKGDPERLALMIERLSAALGMTIALATRGDPRGIDEMIEGATAFAHGEAVEKARVFRLMFGSVSRGGGG